MNILPHENHLLYGSIIILLSTALDLQTERDTIEVIAFLKREDSQRDHEMDNMKEQVNDLTGVTRADKVQLMRRHADQLSQLQSALDSKEKEVSN